MAPRLFFLLLLLLAVHIGDDLARFVRTVAVSPTASPGVRACALGVAAQPIVTQVAIEQHMHFETITEDLFVEDGNTTKTVVRFADGGVGEARTAFFLAIDEVNARLPPDAGYQVVGRAYDTRDRQSAVINALNAMTAPDEGGEGPRTRPTAIVGPQYSVQASTLGVLATNFRMPMVSPSATSPGLVYRPEEEGNQYDYFYRVAPSDMHQARALAGVLMEFGWTEAVCGVFSDDEYGQAFNDALSEVLRDVGIQEGHSVQLDAAEREPGSPTDGDVLLSMVEKLEAAKTDHGCFIFIVMLDRRLDLLARAAITAGMISSDFQWIVADGIVNHFLKTETVTDELAEAMRGFIGTRASRGRGAKSDEFLRLWRERTNATNSVENLYYDDGDGVPTTQQPAYTFDAVLAIGSAISSCFADTGCGLQSASFIDHLDNVSFSGTTGHVGFDGAHSRIGAAYDVVNGVFDEGSGERALHFLGTIELDDTPRPVVIAGLPPDREGIVFAGGSSTPLDPRSLRVLRGLRDNKATIVVSDFLPFWAYILLALFAVCLVVGVGFLAHRFRTRLADRWNRAIKTINESFAVFAKTFLELMETSVDWWAWWTASNAVDTGTVFLVWVIMRTVALVVVAVMRRAIYLGIEDLQIMRTIKLDMVTIFVLHAPLLTMYALVLNDMLREKKEVTVVFLAMWLTAFVLGVKIRWARQHYTAAFVKSVQRARTASKAVSKRPKKRVSSQTAFEHAHGISLDALAKSSSSSSSAEDAVPAAGPPVRRSSSPRASPISATSATVIAIVAVVCVSMGAHSQSYVPPTELTIGSAIQLSYDGETIRGKYGEGRTAFLLAVEHINSNKDILPSTRLVPEWRDSFTFSRAVVDVFELVNEHKAIAVVGPTTSKDVEACAPIAEVFSTPVISPSATRPRLSDRTKFPMVLRAIPSLEQEAAAMVRLCVEHGWDEVCLVRMSDSYGDSGKTEFERYGNRVDPKVTIRHDILIPATIAPYLRTMNPGDPIFEQAVHKTVNEMVDDGIDDCQVLVSFANGDLDMLMESAHRLDLANKGVQWVTASTTTAQTEDSWMRAPNRTEWRRQALGLIGLTTVNAPRPEPNTTDAIFELFRTRTKTMPNTTNDNMVYDDGDGRPTTLATVRTWDATVAVAMAAHALIEEQADPNDGSALMGKLRSMEFPLTGSELFLSWQSESNSPEQFESGIFNVRSSSTPSDIDVPITLVRAGHAVAADGAAEIELTGALTFAGNTSDPVEIKKSADDRFTANVENSFESSTFAVILLIVASSLLALLGIVLTLLVCIRSGPAGFKEAVLAMLRKTNQSKVTFVKIVLDLFDWGGDVFVAAAVAETLGFRDTLTRAYIVFSAIATVMTAYFTFVRISLIRAGTAGSKRKLSMDIVGAFLEDIPMSVLNIFYFSVLVDRGSASGLTLFSSIISGLMFGIKVPSIARLAKLLRQKDSAVLEARIRRSEAVKEREMSVIKARESEASDAKLNDVEIEIKE